MLPKVGTTFFVQGIGLNLRILSGSAAKTLYVEKSTQIQIIANGEEGTQLKVVNPTYFGRPVSQFSDRLILGLSFKDFLMLKKVGVLR